MRDRIQELREVLAIFHRQGVTQVYVARCCERLYVGRMHAQFCRTCAQAPINHDVPTDGSTLDTLRLVL